MKIKIILSIIIFGLLGIVSSQMTMWTCIQNLNGAFCQEYPSTTCGGQCVSPAGSCLQTTRENTAECLLGTCFDPLMGTCNSQTPRALCENSGAQWYSNSPAECSRNCCLINPNSNGGGIEAQYTTERQCNYLGQTLGAPVSWEPVDDEVACLSLAATQAQGACVLEFSETEQAYNCEFTTEADCITSGGDFYEGKLCTNQQLNTICEITQRTSCISGKDEVYFVDSCGNFANIYDSSKINDAVYWSDVVSKQNSCNVGSISNPFANQAGCGNCNYIESNICGEPREGIDSNPIYGNYVCRDLSCVDYENNRREQGESWCRFDSQIGVDDPDVYTSANSTQNTTICGEDGCAQIPQPSRVQGMVNKQRSVDVPGSRHYREVCFNGEVRTEPCQDARGEVCFEEDDSATQETYAACRFNRWAQCLAANEDQQSLNQCETFADCTLKHIKLDYYEFDMCVPKYPQGFSRSTPGNINSLAEDTCSIAGGESLKCTRVEVKHLSGWKCEANCECTTPEFTETMNNLCMSIGDCGAHVSLEGIYTDKGYSLSRRGVRARQSYRDGFADYINPLPGQRVSFYTREEIETVFPNINVEELIGEGGLAQRIVLGTSGIGLLNMDIARGLSVPEAYALHIFSDPLTLLFLHLLGIGDVRKKVVEFNCLPWQPPVPNQNYDCEFCNTDELPCSKYKCESLGSYCEFINEGTSGQQCVDVSPDDVTPPVINVHEIENGFSFTNPQQSVGTEIVSDETSDGCIKEATPLNFSIILDEPGQCKISEEITNSYDDMPDYVDGNNYKLIHRELTAIPDLGSLGVPGVDPSRRGDYNLYIRCQDLNGNWRPNEYVVNFCVRPADDDTAPILRRFAPESPAYSAIGLTEKGIEFYTNEPAECRWSLTDQEYETMENNVACSNEISEITLYGWRCETTLPISGVGTEINYYFRCLDQPWFGGTPQESERNANDQSVGYVIRKTVTPLEITYLAPNEQTIYVGSEPVDVDLEIRTSGGANGDAECEFSADGVYFTPMFDTGGHVHKQNNLALYSGEYDLSYLCEDIARNIANAVGHFSIEIDNLGPQITRAYTNSGNLIVITNEESVCAYSYGTCGFSFEEGILLSGSQYQHTTSLENGQVYRIKCKDIFGNMGTCRTFAGGY